MNTGTVRAVPQIPGVIVAAIAQRLTRELAPPRQRYRPMKVRGIAIGWLNDARAGRLVAFDDVFEVRNDAILVRQGIEHPIELTGALDGITRMLADEGLLTAWRGERYPVAATFGDAPLFLLERAAARYFGIRTWAVHVNGLVRTSEGAAMWIARRSPSKSIDPGMLDNLVGGGIAFGQTVASTVVKEAWEEADIAESLASRAHAAGTVDICREQPDGLQRETLFVHDLWLPADFAPQGRDGEVVGHRLVGPREAAELVANASGPDVVTADASLVIVDCLLRLQAIPTSCPDYAMLDALRHPSTQLAESADRSP